MLHKEDGTEYAGAPGGPHSGAIAGVRHISPHMASCCPSGENWQPEIGRSSPISLHCCARRLTSSSTLLTSLAYS